MPKKKDPYASAGQKVIGLYALLLFSGRRYSLPQLAGLFHCSKQTILRMMEQIELNHRLEIESWFEGGRKWYQARPLRQRPNVTLRVEDIQQLLLCREMVWRLFPAPLREQLGDTIAKTAVLLPDYDERDIALESIAHFQPKGIVDYSRSQPLLAALFRAIRERRVCRIGYRAPEWPRTRTLEVAPYRFVIFREAFYAKCRPVSALAPPVSSKDLTLAVHRMSSITPTGTSFTAITDDDRSADDAFGLAREAPFRVVVDFVPKASVYVRERIWSKDQQLANLPDGGVTLSFTATSRPEVLAWVLSFGGEAVLRAPDDIRHEIRKRLRIMVKSHH